MLDESDDLQLRHLLSDELLEGSSRAKLYKEIETRLIFLVAIVTHDIGMVDLGKLSHDVDFSLVFWDLLQHLLLHKLDSNDTIFTEMIALENHSIIALTQRFGLVDVEIIGHLLHPLHFF